METKTLINHQNEKSNQRKCRNVQKETNASRQWLARQNQFQDALVAEHILLEYPSASAEKNRLIITRQHKKSPGQLLCVRRRL